MITKNLFDITGKSTVVTGACGGLGRVFAEVLAEFGGLHRDRRKEGVII